MKRIALVLLLLFSTSLVYAAAVGPLTESFNDPDKSFWVGTEGDFVFERDMEEDTELKSYITATKINYKIIDRFAAYLLLGMMSAEWGEETTLLMESDWGFLWGLGGTALLYDNLEGFQVFLDGRFRYADLDIGKFKQLGSGVTVPSSSFNYQDWQLAVVASYEFGNITPYAGVKYNDAKIGDLIVNGSTIEGSEQSDKIIGGVVGVNVDSLDFEALYSIFDPEFLTNLSVGIEGRFIDELALSIKIGCKF